MRNSVKFILLIATSFFMLSSCGSFLEDIDVQGDDEIAVVGFISPDDSLVQVALFRAIGIGKERDTEYEEDYIQNATVRISDGQNSYVMSYDKSTYIFADIEDGRNYYDAHPPQFTYQLENEVLNVTEGKTYFLEIETDKGEKLSASCTVPVGKAIPTVELTKLNEQEYKYKYKAEWQDDLSRTNYYRLDAYKASVIRNFDYETGEYLEPSFQLSPTYFYDTYFQTQEGRSIIKYNSQETIYFNRYSNADPVDNPNPYVVTYLIKADENYYRYHKTVEDSYYNEGNPFGEPIIIHSNIENGIGCFGAYITGKVITEVK